jgi:SAM-dependent methyltransferase
VLEIKEVLNIGCGFDKIKGAVNLDFDKRCNPDCLCDVTEGLPFESDSFDMVIANNVLEHIFCFESVVIEIHRILKLGGRFVAEVPLWPSRVSVAGDGHVRQFVAETFVIYTNPSYFQPKKHPSDVAGLFDVISILKNEVPCETGNPGEWITNLKVDLKKVDKWYWKEMGVDRNLQNDVLGCFWCQHELEYDQDRNGKIIKKCPNCFETFEILK